MTILWWQDALDDLNRIYEFQTQQNKKTAIKLFNNIIEETESLSEFPYIGSIDPMIEPALFTFRSLVIKPGRYKVFYFISEEVNEIVISHVWDCRQDPQNIRQY